MTRTHVACVAAALLALAAPCFAVDPAVRRMARDPDSGKRADAARALARDGTADATKILVELLADESAPVRDQTVLECSNLRDAGAVAVLATAARSRDDLMRRNAADALGRTLLPEALPVLERLATRDASPHVRAVAVDALRGFAGAADAMAIARAAYADADPRVRAAAAAEAAGRIGAQGALGVVRVALGDPDEGVRCVARAALRGLVPEEALAGLVAAAADPSWRVRAQVVDDALALVSAPASTPVSTPTATSAIDALVLLVGDSTLRVSAAAHRALRDLTGKDLGRDGDLWKAWWAENRTSWKPPADAGSNGDARDDPKRTIVRYHGLEIASDRAAFVADLSGSMRLPMGESDGRVRWDVARAELEQALSALPDEFTTNLVFFQVEAVAAFPRPVALSKPARKAALAFVEGGSPGQTGNLLAGVLLALDDDAIDTVYLLSDGAPSAGEVVDRGRVRAAIRDRNRTRKCAIHCIGFGANRTTERAFLEGVSADAGGRVVFRGGGAK